MSLYLPLRMDEKKPRRQQLRPSRRELLGFNDYWLMLFGIPAVSVFGAHAFAAVPPIGLLFDWPVYLMSTVFTCLYWLGNREITLFIRRRYFFSDREPYRLAILLVAVVVYSLSIGFLGWMLSAMSPEAVNHSKGTTLGGVLITFFVLSIYEAVWNASKFRNARIEMEQARSAQMQSELNALKAQVNPHFLFNNLNTLSALIAEDESMALGFVDRLSFVYRNLLEVKDKEFVTLQSELKFTHAYIYLLKMRFDEALEVLQHFSPEAEKRYIVPLALQLVVENAIKHNVASRKAPLRITFDMRSGDAVVVTNNLQPKEVAEPSTGIGMTAISARYKALGIHTVEWGAKNGVFEVKLPLLTIESYANSHH